MAAINFATSLAVTLEFEGGFSNHSADPGGATNFGITRSVLARWRGHGVSSADVRAMPKAEAAAIYRRNYWQAAACDDLPAGIDLAVFDYAVNSGVPRAVRALQQELSLTSDGVAGPRTITAARHADARDVICGLCRRRRGFLQALPIFSVFGRGWLRRVAAIESRALALAASTAPSSSHLLQTKELPQMTLSKSILESRTVWSNLIGIGALAASAFGFDLGVADQSGLVDSVLKVVAGASFVASTLFRIKATKKLA